MQATTVVFCHRIIVISHFLKQNDVLIQVKSLLRISFQFEFIAKIC